MYQPSHTNSSVNQVANAYMGNPQALKQRTQPQMGVTPELVDLLAMQKIESDKKAAVTAMQLKSGQGTPTVARGLKDQVEKSAKEDVAQKLGLMGLMAGRAQAGQKAQMTQQAMQPGPAPEGILQPEPQPEEGEGIASLPSNIGEFQTGGIVAFVEGGPTVITADQEIASAASKIQTTTDPQEKAALVARLSTLLQQNKAPAAARPQSSMSVADRHPMPVSPPEDIALREATQKAATAGMGIDTAAAGAAGRERYQTEIGAGQDASIEAQRKRSEGIQALYDRQASERPSQLMRGLQLMGKNTRSRGFGGAFEGVSEGIDTTNAGYTKQDIANQESIDKLASLREEAKKTNDIGRYNAYDKALKEAMEEKAGGLRSATQMVDVNARNLSEQIRNIESIKQREQAALDAKLTRGEISAQTAEIRRGELERKIEADKARVLQQQEELASKAVARAELAYKNNPDVKKIEETLQFMTNVKKPEQLAQKAALEAQLVRMKAEHFAAQKVPAEFMPQAPAATKTAPIPTDIMSILAKYK
jgi:hypothetical protein